MLSFSAFIATARITDDPAGDFLLDARTDLRLPADVANQSVLIRYLQRRGASNHVIFAAVPTVWRRYRAACRRAERAK